jgi:hypothetical protein
MPRTWFERFIDAVCYAASMDKAELISHLLLGVLLAAVSVAAMLASVVLVHRLHATSVTMPHTGIMVCSIGLSDEEITEGGTSRCGGKD